MSQLHTSPSSHPLHPPFTTPSTYCLFKHCAPRPGLTPRTRVPPPSSSTSSPSRSSPLHLLSLSLSLSHASKKPKGPFVLRRRHFSSRNSSARSLPIVISFPRDASSPLPPPALTVSNANSSGQKPFSALYPFLRGVFASEYLTDTSSLPPPPSQIRLSLFSSFSNASSHWLRFLKER